VRTAIKSACATSILLETRPHRLGASRPLLNSYSTERSRSEGRPFDDFNRDTSIGTQSVKSISGDQRLPKFSGSKLGPGCWPPASEVRTTLCPVSSKRLRQRIFLQATISSTRTM